jgi:SNF2 family DNA or RNA helicase
MSMETPLTCLVLPPHQQNEKGYLSENLRQLKCNHRCLVIGMTGTLMQNDHSELWNLVDLVETDYLGTYKDFKRQVSIPIKIAR